MIFILLLNRTVFAEALQSDIAFAARDVFLLSLGSAVRVLVTSLHLTWGPWSARAAILLYF
jgi:hypothetical protein